MPQALMLTQKTIVAHSIKTELPIKDVQALLEHRQSTGVTSYIVFDYTNEKGYYVPWFDMSADEFREQFQFPFGENPNKFMPVCSI